VSLEAIKSGGVKSGVSMQYYALRATAWQMSCVTSHQVKASHRWWVCNKLHHAWIIPEQYAAKIVKISQQMAKLRWKLKWLVFFWDIWQINVFFVHKKTCIVITGGLFLSADGANAQGFY